MQTLRVSAYHWNIYQIKISKPYIYTEEFWFPCMFFHKYPIACDGVLNVSLTIQMGVSKSAELLMKL